MLLPVDYASVIKLVFHWRWGNTHPISVLYVKSKEQQKQIKQILIARNKGMKSTWDIQSTETLLPILNCFPSNTYQSSERVVLYLEIWLNVIGSSQIILLSHICI